MSKKNDLLEIKLNKYQFILDKRDIKYLIIPVFISFITFSLFSFLPTKWESVAIIEVGQIDTLPEALLKTTSYFHVDLYDKVAIKLKMSPPYDLTLKKEHLPVTKTTIIRDTQLIEIRAQSSLPEIGQKQIEHSLKLIKIGHDDIFNKTLERYYQKGELIKSSLKELKNLENKLPSASPIMSLANIQKKDLETKMKEIDSIIKSKMTFKTRINGVITTQRISPTTRNISLSLFVFIVSFFFTYIWLLFSRSAVKFR